MKGSGLVREDGKTRVTDFARELMVEAVDGAVEMIVSMMEGRKSLGMDVEVCKVKDVLAAVDERLGDFSDGMSVGLEGGSTGLGNGGLILPPTGIDPIGPERIAIR